MTKRESILTAVQNALTGTTGVGDRIFRSRMAAFRRAEFPALNIEPVNDSASREATGRLSWQFNFIVTTMLDAETPDRDADPVLSDIHEKVMNDPAVQALVVDIFPVSTDWQFIQSEQVLLIANMHFQATYQTKENDLTTT